MTDTPAAPVAAAPLPQPSLSDPGPAALMAACPPHVRRQAENMVKAGFSISGVIKSLVDAGHRAPVVPEGEQPYTDARSAAQRQHDDNWDVQPAIDPQSYHFQPRADIDAKPGQIAQVEADARPLLADLGFGQRDGASFVDSILQTVKDGAAMTPEARLSLPEKWESDGRAILKGDRYDAAVTDARNLLEQAGADNRLVKDLLATGAWRAPSILIPLYHRSAALKAWSANRPTK